MGLIGRLQRQVIQQQAAASETERERKADAAIASHLEILKLRSDLVTVTTPPVLTEQYGRRLPGSIRRRPSTGRACWR